MIGIAVISFVAGRLSAPTVTSETLADTLSSLGITQERISHFRFVGDESSMTLGYEHIETDVDWIWSKYIATAVPYDHWLSSGNRICEIYLHDDTTSPSLTLYVNETGRTSSKKFVGGYICSGLGDMISGILRSKRDNANKAGEPL